MPGTVSPQLGVTISAQVQNSIPPPDDHGASESDVTLPANSLATPTPSPQAPAPHPLPPRSKPLFLSPEPPPPQSSSAHRLAATLNPQAPLHTVAPQPIPALPQTSSVSLVSPNILLKAAHVSAPAPPPQSSPLPPLRAPNASAPAPPAQTPSVHLAEPRQAAPIAILAPTPSSISDLNLPSYQRAEGPSPSPALPPVLDLAILPSRHGKELGLPSSHSNPTAIRTQQHQAPYSCSHRPCTTTPIRELPGRCKRGPGHR